MTRLADQELAQLKTAGVISEAEFDAAKAKLPGSSRGQEPTPDPDAGIDFPRVDGEVSTTRVGRGAWSRSGRRRRPEIGGADRGSAHWRKGYLAPFRQLTEVSAISPRTPSRSAPPGWTTCGTPCGSSGRFVRTRC